MSGDQPTESTAEDAEVHEEERRRRQERRSLIDLTRAERGEPERRRLPGVERRGTDEDDEAPPSDR